MTRPDYREIQYLSHSAKGTTWNKHKYVRKENGRYVYPSDEKKDRKLAFSSSDRWNKNRNAAATAIRTNSGVSKVAKAAGQAYLPERKIEGEGNSKNREQRDSSFETAKKKYEKKQQAKKDNLKKQQKEKARKREEAKAKANDKKLEKQNQYLRNDKNARKFSKKVSSWNNENTVDLYYGKSGTAERSLKKKYGSASDINKKRGQEYMKKVLKKKRR